MPDNPSTWTVQTWDQDKWTTHATYTTGGGKNAYLTLESLRFRGPARLLGDGELIEGDNPATYYA